MFDYLGLLQVTGSFIILTTLYPTQLSPVFFPLPLPLHLFSLPLSSSAMFLASRCLTYFLRLLQCSPPLYRENTHIHSEVLNHPPTSTPVPAPLSLGSRIAPAGPAQDSPSLAEHQKTFTSTNQANKESFALKCYTLIFLCYCFHYSLQ